MTVARTRCRIGRCALRDDGVFQHIGVIAGMKGVTVTEHGERPDAGTMRRMEPEARRASIFEARTYAAGVLLQSNALVMHNKLSTSGSDSRPNGVSISD